MTPFLPEPRERPASGYEHLVQVSVSPPGFLA